MPARKDGRDQWFYRKWVTDWTGTKVRIFGTPPINTKAAAEAAERAHITRVSVPPLPGAVAEREVQTLEDFITKRWWPKYPPAAGNAETTMREKEIHIRVHLIPLLGHLPLNAIKGEVIDGFFAALATATKKPKRRACSPKYVKNLRSTLRKVLVKAVEWGDIATLPAIPKIKVTERETDWFNADETRTLLAATRSPEERLLILFAIHTGARAGEQRVLEWGDLDLVNGKVQIRRSLSEFCTVAKAPKSGKPRTVPLTAELLETLKRARGLQHLQGGLVFKHPDDGEAWEGKQLRERLGLLCRRAGLREIRWHDLRHSFASQLSAAGVPLRQIQEWMGHATIQMTMRYASLAPDNGGAINVLCSGASENSPEIQGGHRTPSLRPSGPPRARPVLGQPTQYDHTSPGEPDHERLGSRWAANSVPLPKSL